MNRNGTRVLALAIALGSALAFAADDAPEQAKKAADTAQKAADTAEKASDTAKKASDTAEKATDTAKKAADTAKKATDTAEKAADSAKKATDTAKKATDTAQKATDTAKKATDTAQAAPAMSAEQKAMMDSYAKMAEVRAEHKQLGYFVGKWNAKTTMVMDPKAPPETGTGKAETKVVMGGRSYETSYQGTYNGQPFNGHGYMGYDNLKGKFYNSWMDDMSTGMWLAYGTYDAATKTYTFKGEMDDPMKPGKVVPIRQVMRIVDDKNWVFEWHEMRDGKEVKAMWIEYTKA